MKQQVSININVVKPLNFDVLNTKYAEAVFKITKNKVSACFLEEFLEKLKSDINLSDHA